ncbi:MAG: tyrosine-type recombinase/integrase [Chloroflexia bacterium]
MASRRGKGEGSICQRASDGLWVGTVNLGYGPDGKRKRKAIYGKTRKEVAEKMKAALHEQQQGILPRDTKRQTVEQYLSDWLENSVKPTVRPKTHESYRQLCNLYIIPSLGRHQLKELSPQQIRAFLNYLSQQTVKRTSTLMSARTVTYCHAILRRSLNQAVKLGLIARNPYDASNIIHQFHRSLERVGLSRIKFHELRHTCASLLLAQGVPMKVVQEILGHSDYYLTANTYSHVVPELKREAADRLDALFASNN